MHEKMVQLENDRIKQFVLGGNATITIESGKTGRHFTYKIRRSENDDNLYFIKNLRGSDNENDYVYVGCFFSDTKKFVVEKSYRDKEVSSWPTSIRAIRYLFNNLDDVPYMLHVYHEGRCCRCGRILTTPESIKKGIGPECEKESRQ
jgi:hypothetical protein